MTKYRYRAKDPKGKIVRSSIEANSGDEAIDKISRLGLYPLSVDELSSAHGEALKGTSALRGRAVGRNVTLFSRELASLIKNGVPILKSIDMLSEQARDPLFKRVLEDIYINIKDGGDFSSALRLYPELFNSFFISLVQAGEENGTLPESLLRISKYRKTEELLLAKVKGALVYPAMIALVGFFTILFILTYVMPKLTLLITDMGMELPLATRFLVGLVDFLHHNILWVLCGIAGFFVVMRAVPVNPKGRRSLDALTLELPFFGDFIVRSEFVKFARTLEASLNNGLQLLKSFELSMSVVGNTIIRDQLMAYYEDVKSGLNLGLSMKRSRIFPPSVGNMITVGEESGRLAEVLGQIAEDYESSNEESIKVMTTLIEPSVIIVVGAIIAFIVVALLLPVFQINMLAAGV